MHRQRSERRTRRPAEDATLSVPDGHRALGSRYSSRHREYGVGNAYRPPQIEPSQHMDKAGRSISIFDDFNFVEAPGL